MVPIDAAAADGVDEEPVPTRITLSVGAFFTKELIILEDMTLPPDLVTRFVVSITPFAPSVSTFSCPFGRLEVSFLTVLNAISVSDTSTEAPARSILMTVFSFTFVSKDGETVSSVSRVMSPASSTDFTSVKCMPGTTRVLPLIFTVTYEVSPESASRALPREASMLSVTEYAVTCLAGDFSAVAYRLCDTMPPVANSPTAATVATIFTI